MNALKSHKSLYDLVVVDSKGIEMDFANQLESRNEVAVYTKLPNGFYINTPVGHYNPDWAVVFHEGSDIKHIYFVAETKGYDKDSLKDYLLYNSVIIGCYNVAYLCRIFVYNEVQQRPECHIFTI